MGMTGSQIVNNGDNRSGSDTDINKPPENKAIPRLIKTGKIIIPRKTQILSL